MVTTHNSPASESAQSPYDLPQYTHPQGLHIYRP